VEKDGGGGRSCNGGLVLTTALRFRSRGRQKAGMSRSIAKGVSDRNGEKGGLSIIYFAIVT